MPIQQRFKSNKLTIRIDLTLLSFRLEDHQKALSILQQYGIVAMLVTCKKEI